VWDEVCAPGFVAYVAGQGGPLNLAGYKGYLQGLYPVYPDLKHSVRYQLEDGDSLVSVILTASNLAVFIVVLDRFKDGLETRRMVFDSASLRGLGLIE
jgi:hypothetical protein